MLPKGKSGVWGRKLGHMAGLAYAAGQFVHAFLLFTATGAEAIATPLSGGASAIAIPATAAAAVVCTADGCRVFNNYLNQRPVEQATSNNDAGGGENKGKHSEQNQINDIKEFKNEVVLEKVKTFEQARNKALEIIGDLGQGTEPFVGKFDIAKGRIVGRQSKDGKKLWRLDWDLEKGIHINVNDFSKGKSGRGGLKMVIPLEGDYELYAALLKHLNK